MIKKNDEFILEITDLGTNGEGIGKLTQEGEDKGYTLFVKDALIGDCVRVKVIKSKKNYGYGRLMEILTPSPYRVPAKCPVSRTCGGCQIMHLDYKEQLRFKENKVRNLLERVGKLQDFQMLPIIGMKEPYYYRNKAQFPWEKIKKERSLWAFMPDTLIPL